MQNVKVSSKAFSVSLLGYIIYSFSYICRYTLTISGQALQNDGVLTLTQYGYIMSAFSVCYAIGRFANGIIGDYVPAKVMVVSGITLAGIFTALFGTLAPFTFLILFWGAVGFFESMLWGPLLVTITSKFPESKRNTVGAIFGTSVGTGSLLGILLATLLCNYVSVSAAFTVPGAISSVLGIVALLVFDKTDKTVPKAQAPLVKSTGAAELVKVFFVSLFMGIIKDNSTYFAPAVFVDMYHIDLKKMALFIFAIPLLTLVGRTAFPFVYKLCGRNEFLTGALSFGIIALATLPLFIGTDLPIVAAVSLSLTSAASAVIGTAMSSSYSIRHYKTGNVSSMSGFVDFAAYLGAAIGSSAYATAITVFGYKSMFASWIAFAVLGAGMILLLGKRWK